MKEILYLVCLEKIDGDEVVESREILNTDNYEDALEYAMKWLERKPLEEEQLTIQRIESVDGEYDYESAELLWVF